MYIATYHHRERINFGVFKRNVMFFKTIALTHLCWNYLAGNIAIEHLVLLVSRMRQPPLGEPFLPTLFRQAP
jgi:hypothetical protein